LKQAKSAQKRQVLRECGNVVSASPPPLGKLKEGFSNPLVWLVVVALVFTAYDNYRKSVGHQPRCASTGRTRSLFPLRERRAKKSTLSASTGSPIFLRDGKHRRPGRRT
jgi:hypothetical protein